MAQDRLMELAQAAKTASRALARLNELQKNEALKAMAAALCAHEEEILTANALDIEAAKANNMSAAFIDRLLLNPKRIAGMADGLRQVASLPDPVGKVYWMDRRPNGLMVGQKSVPLGVIGMIYESRPNVTVDAVGLCLKSGNAVLLRGGSDAIRSSISLAAAMREGANAAGLPEGAFAVLEDTSRETAQRMMRLNGLIDVLIPRGNLGLIQTVVQQATVPVIETGIGNCHVFVDTSADLDMAVNIVVNAKTSRLSVCNTMESLLVHRDIAERFLPVCLTKLHELGVEIRGCEETRRLFSPVIPATEQDYAAEFLDAILSCRVVSDIDEAMAHIAFYGTMHSEAIVTRDYFNAQRFLEEVDSAAVYVNASTRFTDGEVFGFGAEIGISTQKLHARGPVGLRELTSTKYIIYGDGQIR